MRKRGKLFWKILLALSCIGCVCCIFFVLGYLYQNQEAAKQYEDIRESFAVEEETQRETQVTVEEIEEAEFTGSLEGEAASLPDDIFLDMENPIDFEKLEEINPDLYAWIRIPGTVIDYPVAQREGDDSYYLTHDMYQEPRFAGCIYSEDCNSKDFTDPNTVLYGHNMKNQTMFQNLHLFSDYDFFQEHPYVYIYMPGHVLVYKIFAAYTYDDRHIMNSFDFTDPEVFEAYLDEIFHMRAMDRNLRDDVSVSAEDRIITLATCIAGQTQSRYLVQAVLIKDGADG